MHVIRSYSHVPELLRGASLAVGNFDGVHRGHRSVFAQAKEEGAASGAHLTGVIIFDPHPRHYFRPDEPHFTITPLPLKLNLLEEAGLDVCVVLAFNAELAGLPPEMFIETILVRGLGVRHVAVGKDFRFGHKRSGDLRLLREHGRVSGFGVSEVSPVMEGGEVISSTRIRSLLTAGDVDKAAALLGYWWRVRGRVMHGAGRGEGLGFPTANLTLLPGQTLAHGIYASRVIVDGQRFDAASYLGTRPTFDNGRPVLESFLFDFDGDLYGREIDIEFIQRLRGDRAFDSPDELAAQMDVDCRNAKTALAGAGPLPV